MTPLGNATAHHHGSRRRVQGRGGADRRVSGIFVRGNKVCGWGGKGWAREYYCSVSYACEILRGGEGGRGEAKKIHGTLYRVGGYGSYGDEAPESGFDRVVLLCRLYVVGVVGCSGAKVAMGICWIERKRLGGGERVERETLRSS